MERDFVSNSDYIVYDSAGALYPYCGGDGCRVFIKIEGRTGILYNIAVTLSLMALFSYFEPATFFYLRYLSFNKGQRGWQFACRAVVAPYEFTAVRVDKV